jgi:hypothetical protein
VYPPLPSAAQPSAAPYTSYPLPYITSGERKKEREKIYLVPGMTIKMNVAQCLNFDKKWAQ